MLRERLPIGPAELFAENLLALAHAGVQRVFLWPVADEVHQLSCSGRPYNRRSPPSSVEPGVGLPVPAAA